MSTPDIQPENVLLAGYSGSELRTWYALVAAFGIARIASRCSGLASTDASIGTPAYTSPEQAPATER